MKLVFAAICLVSALGLSKLQAGAPVEAPAMNLVEESSVVDQEEEGALCPRRWTCNGSGWYDTRVACEAACGGVPCERDHDCRGGCICP